MSIITSSNCSNRIIMLIQMADNKNHWQLTVECVGSQSTHHLMIHGLHTADEYSPSRCCMVTVTRRLSVNQCMKHHPKQSQSPVTVLSTIHHVTCSLLVTAYFNFYPRDAMLARVIAIATCLSVRLSRAGIVSKRRKLAVWFLHHLVAPRL